MYVMLKHKLPVLAALFLGASIPALAANESAGDCSFNATATAQNLCHDQAVMRDYALGLTSDTFVDTPPVSLDGGNASPKGPGPLSLLPGGSTQAARQPEKTSGAKAQQPVAPKNEVKPSRVATKLPKVTGTLDVTARTPRGPDGFNSLATLDNTAQSSLAQKTPGAFRSHTPADDAPQRRYVALGDFATPNEATEVARKFNLWTPRIQHVYVNGRHFSRVLVGPFADRSIKSVQKHLDQHGFSTAWPLRATADATPDTLIARYPGDG